MDEPIKSSVKIIVVGMKPLRQLEKGSVLDFQGRAADGTIATYNLFAFKDGPNLIDLVKPGADLALDIETVKRQGNDGQTYTDHKVMAINGQSRSGKAGGKGGGGWRGSEDSPEKRASIEAQTAVNAIFSVRVAVQAQVEASKEPASPGHFMIPSELALYNKALAWCEKALDYKPVAAQPKSAPAAAPQSGPAATSGQTAAHNPPAAATAQPAQTAGPAATTQPQAATKAKAQPTKKAEPAPEVFKRDPALVTNFSQLSFAAHEDFALQPKQTLEMLGIASKAEIKDYPEAYRQIARRVASQAAVDAAQHQ
jgi:hypothetical protein